MKNIIKYIIGILPTIIIIGILAWQNATQTARIEHLQRGYDQLQADYRSLDGDIEILQDEMTAVLDTLRIDW